MTHTRSDAMHQCGEHSLEWKLELLLERLLANIHVQHTLLYGTEERTTDTYMYIESRLTSLVPNLDHRKEQRSSTAELTILLIHVLEAMLCINEANVR